MPEPEVPLADNVIVSDSGQVDPDDDTAPLPVILRDQPGPAQKPRQRGPFEPASRAAQPSSTGPADLATGPGAGADHVAAEPAGSPADADGPPKAGAAKLDQIKDLYLTAEAIGDEALSRHFQQVSDRQRQLIREYFDQTATKQPEGSGQGTSQNQG